MKVDSKYLESIIPYKRDNVVPTMTPEEISSSIKKLTEYMQEIARDSRKGVLGSNHKREGMLHATEHFGVVAEIYLSCNTGENTSKYYNKLAGGFQSAIKHLEYAGFPKEIVEKAKSLGNHMEALSEQSITRRYPPKDEYASYLASLPQTPKNKEKIEEIVRRLDIVLPNNVITTGSEINNSIPHAKKDGRSI